MKTARLKGVNQMPRTVAVGIQDFSEIIGNDYFYVDKTDFIREWWNGGDAVTLITRPRRFGKTLLLNTVDRFFSNQYKDQAKYFEGLSVWEDEWLRSLQGTVPVIFLSFANIKESTYNDAVESMAGEIVNLLNRYEFVLESDCMNIRQKDSFIRTLKILGKENPDHLQGQERIANIAGAIKTSLKDLSIYLYQYYDQKVVILLDEYDTPMQEAYVNGYWTEITQLLRSLFNSTFKTNPYMSRALMTGITRVSRESMFSDLNNLKVISTTTGKYETAFGFTEDEVYAAMDEYGFDDQAKAGVKQWYDGFTFGNVSNIYNPWSILNYLQEGQFGPYWSNTSGNALASKLIREGGSNLKQDFEKLLQGETITSKIDEQIVFGEIGRKPAGIWSLLLASGYLKVIKVSGDPSRKQDYELALTNQEVKMCFEDMVERWFDAADEEYGEFTSALLRGDLENMNYYMNEVSLATFSSFDTGTHPSGRSQPERFYHGFVLGLIVDLKERYHILSNRESGLGRYDVILEPMDKAKDDAIILEFKVKDPKKEASLEDTVASALDQIRDKHYARSLMDRGIPEDRIHCYGFAFEGKMVLIG